ncbi:MAG: M20/M25/M40 family metallo-hydrolase [Myxococcota bacterium]|jgi:acetylornithine deacetylase/succinyl-diaminopimelate desuccinylase-like protein|nr:dipeptidase [Deltaproteobacteria bacterium]MCP4242841.1 M20/M25/M40 family metallo-hydrolase [bacterium]MDP6075682.1 M20/M25/M40 family metallo-hydrolase [Myxococcota bacterium]MDP7075426.1 M20/M25/M40 family metallo-hydrolase [Myxococcota bacterium]MDP7299589.1 M20/M25/M40 family metallo-hydrolase [Myxococcota bacterium]
MGAPTRVLDAIDRRFDASVAELVELARIPGVSAESFEPAELERSAEAVAGLLGDVGLDSVEVLRVPGAHPYVVAEKRAADPDAPTALVYAHHDVQPPGRLDRWETPAFEPTVREDGRLYGRGVVDDKAGLCLHAAALRAWLETEGALPLHVKLVVEGEEEIGSGHLTDFLRQHRERLAADVLVVSDTQNLDTGVPSLTTSLRGIVQIDVSLRVLEHNVHSGMWGGPVPDAATALSRLLGRLIDDAGVPAVPGLDADVPELDPEERARIAELSFDEASFRGAAGLVSGVSLVGPDDVSVYERLWHRPAVAVTALEAVPFATAANQLVDEARARVGVRIAPGQDPERVADCVIRFLTRVPPVGARVEARAVAKVAGWRTQPDGPAFDAARRALTAGFGRDAVTIGCGGTIPFVGPFGEVMGGVPQLLLGLEDPPCNAHGENESLDLDDFRKAAHASAHLLSELGVALR